MIFHQEITMFRCDQMKNETVIVCLIFWASMFYVVSNTQGNIHNSIN